MLDSRREPATDMGYQNRDIIVVGASAGGVQALQRLAGGLPADLPASVFVVLHIWPGAPSHLSEILNRAGPLPAIEAENGMPIERGAPWTWMSIQSEEDGERRR